MPDIKYILWAFIFGVGGATIYTFYTTSILGVLVRKLIAIDACSPETAISLEQIDYKLNSAVKYSLRKGTSYSETVKIDENGNYYINPLHLKRAKIKYKNEGMTVFVLFTTLIILAGVALISTYIYPEAIDRINEFIGGL
ncbi:MAG: hypothetical protein CVU97_03705 [Firmicutes bacterium HGW-Firmicutes-21]|nr:MAG: hypothetical protein CVU97_03705 [Firmicutes bacterium HGW-Firmicutes-21]